MTILLFLAALPFAMFGLLMIVGAAEAFLSSNFFLWMLLIGGAVWFLNTEWWINWFYG